MYARRGNERDQYLYAAGMSDVQRVTAKWRADQLAADKEARERKYSATAKDFADFWANHTQSEPEVPPESVFNGVTNLGVVKPLSKSYYQNLHEEVKAAWETEITKALNRAALPEGHPRKLSVETEKIH